MAPTPSLPWHAEWGRADTGGKTSFTAQKAGSQSDATARESSYKHASSLLSSFPLSIRQSTHPSVYLCSIHPSVCPPILPPSTLTPIHLSPHQSVHPSILPSTGPADVCSVKHCVTHCKRITYEDGQPAGAWASAAAGRCPPAGLGEVPESWREIQAGSPGPPAGRGQGPGTRGA